DLPQLRRGCQKIAVVVTANIVLSVPQAVEPINDRSQRRRDAGLRGDLREVFAICGRRRETRPALLFDPEQRRQEDEVAGFTILALCSGPLRRGQGIGCCWGELTG